MNQLAFFPQRPSLEPEQAWSQTANNTDRIANLIAWRGDELGSMLLFVGVCIIVHAVLTSATHWIIAANRNWK
jgi:hypothetical protein